MRILNVNMSLDPVIGAGTAERTFQMSYYLALAGMDCTVLTTDMGMTPEWRQAMKNVRIVALPILSKRFYIPDARGCDVMELVADSDIIHLMNHWTLLNTLVYRAARRLRKPYVVCPAGSLPIYGRSKLMKKVYRTIVGDSMIRHASGYIAVTADEKKHFREYGIMPDRVSVIPNGIPDGERWGYNPTAFRRTFGLGNVPFVLFVGRLNLIKGPDLLLQAFCNIRDRIGDVHLVFVGPDEGLLIDLQKTVDEFDVKDRVHFLGYLGGQDKVQAYQAASLLVVPSRHEAMSIVALEAGINGTPVLLTDQCGFDDVAHVGGGMVVKASTEGLQAGLLKMMMDDASQLKSMGEKLKIHVSNHYLWNSIVHQYITLYRCILSEKPSSIM